MENPASHRDGWTIRPGAAAMRITNPIRDIVDKLKLPPNHSKQPISLSIGDPTVFGNLQTPHEVEEALVANLQTRKYNGYALSHGYPSAKRSIASRFSCTHAPLTEDDVIITSGCSSALEIAMSALINDGDNALIPAPGFSLYQTILAYKGIQPRYYKLDPEKNWEIDLDDLESKIDSKSAFILVNNPSNPCGSVYSKEHLQDIMKLAEKKKIPIIADEIYRDLVFQGREFIPLASLTTTVPVLSVGGLAKAYMIPGWRVGWILVHDRNNVLADVRVALIKLTQLILGANTLAQSIIDAALHSVPASYPRFLFHIMGQLLFSFSPLPLQLPHGSYYSDVNMILASHATLLCDKLEAVDGLSVVRPGGAMYLMVRIDTTKFKDINDDVEFARLLVMEENVVVLPATIFQCPNFVRLVICPPPDKLEEACTRIESFCQRHRI